MNVLEKYEPKIVLDYCTLKVQTLNMKSKCKVSRPYKVAGAQPFILEQTIKNMNGIGKFYEEKSLLCAFVSAALAASHKLLTFSWK